MKNRPRTITISFGRLGLRGRLLRHGPPARASSHPKHVEYDWSTVGPLTRAWLAAGCPNKRAYLAWRFNYDRQTAAAES